MLTPRQYEIIGRVAIGFNEIDFLVGLYLSRFLGTHEIEMGEKISSRANLSGRRRELFLEVLDVVASKYPELESLITPVRISAQRAATLSVKRNEVVHGLLVFGRNPGEYALRYRDQDLMWDEADLSVLAQQLSLVEESLTASCHDLLEALNAKRV